MPDDHYANHRNRTVIIHTEQYSISMKKRTCVCVTFTMIVAWLGRWWCAHGVRLITYLREREERETMRDEKSIWFCVCMSVSSEWMRVYYEWDHPHTEQTESGFEDFDKLGFTKSPHRNRRYQCACAGNDRSIRPNNNRNGKCSSFVWCSDLFAPTDRSLPTAGLNPFPPHLQPIFVW